MRALLIALLLLARTASAITLADPAHFSVTATFTPAVTTPFGGLRFSADGTTLYAVGAADTTSSGVWAMTVTRNPGTMRVTSLGTPTKVISGANPDVDPAGIDAGLAFGPSGSLFYTYFPSTYLAHRAGIAGVQSAFQIPGIGSLSGLAFSPHRIDPGTGSGKLQITTGLGTFIYEVALVPAVTPGYYMLPPGGFPTLFAKAFRAGPPRVGGQGVTALEYVPGGAHSGDLLYTSFVDREIWRIRIDAATGLPIGGQNDPEMELFASGFVGSPLGLAFDPTHPDTLFAATWDDMTSGNNVIHQIAGFSAVFGSTTTSSSTSTTTSTSSSSSSSSSTSTSSSSSTSTTSTSTSTSSSSSSSTSTSTSTSSSSSSTSTSSSSSTSTSTPGTTSSTSTAAPGSTSTTVTTTSSTSSSSSTTAPPGSTTSSSTSVPSSSSTSSSSTPSSSTSAPSSSTTSSTTSPSSSTSTTSTTSTSTSSTSSSTSTASSTTGPSSTTSPSATTSTVPPTSTTSTATSSSTSTSGEPPTSSTSSSSSTSAPAPTTTLPPLCDAFDPESCEDGDPCTLDACDPAIGCVGTEVTGLASITCTCRRAYPSTCSPAGPPSSVSALRDRACRTFARAASGSPKAQARRLRRGAAQLRRATVRVGKLSARGRIASACAVPLLEQLHDARDRALQLAAVR